MWPQTSHQVVLYLSSLLEGANKIKLFVTGSHNGYLTYVNDSNSLRQTKKERQSAAGGIAVTAVLTMCDVTGAANLNAEHTEVSLNAKAKHCERTVFLIMPPVTALASICPEIPVRQHRVRVRKRTHAWPLLLKKESNKSFQTALEMRGDTTRSKQPPKVTPLLLQRELRKLRAGVGTDRNAAQQNEKALLPTGSF